MCSPREARRGGLAHGQIACRFKKDRKWVLRFVRSSRIVLPRAKAQQASIGMSFNGRTADSGSVNGGSTPSIPAICLSSKHLARSSSGSGRRPLKAEITSSNLVRATMISSEHLGSVGFGPYIWPVRLAVQDAALSRRRSPVRIWYGLPNLISVDAAQWCVHRFCMRHQRAGREVCGTSALAESCPVPARAGSWAFDRVAFSRATTGVGAATLLVCEAHPASASVSLFARIV